MPINPQLRNSLTARQNIPAGDINTLPSATEPDQVLSIKQIIERHTTGIQPDVQHYEPFYTEEELPNFEFMDIEELAQYRQHLADERYRLEDKLSELKKKETEEIRKQNEEKLKQKWLADQTKAQAQTTP